MADWTEQDTDGLLPGEPWTSAKAIAAFENPVAITEGAPNAPRVQADAMQGSVAGDTVLFGTGGTGVTYLTSGYVQDATFKATTDCEVRLKFDHRSNGDATTSVEAEVYKNDTVVLSHSTGISSYSAQSVDITLTAGDIVRLKGGSASDSAGNSTSEFRNITYNTTSGQRSVGGI